MSKLQFIDTPFPDNHDGFDYAPKSFTEVQNEMESEFAQRERANSENKMLSMLTSIMK